MGLVESARIGKLRRFAAFDRLDARLGANADLADVARELTARVLAEWPVAESALVLAGALGLPASIGDRIQARAAQLAGG